MPTLLADESPSLCAAIGLKSSPRTQYGQRITSLVSCAGMAGDGKRSPETFARRLPHLRVAQSRPGQSRATGVTGEMARQSKGMAL
jgi:hypothetical protein